MKHKGILIDFSSYPFLELHPQLNLNLNFKDNNSVEFKEEPFFTGGKIIDYKESLEVSFFPTLKTNKLKRESIMRCPFCGKVVSYDVDDALKIALTYKSDKIDLTCGWCKSLLQLDKDYVENCTVRYKEVK